MKRSLNFLTRAACAAAILTTHAAMCQNTSVQTISTMAGAGIAPPLAVPAQLSDWESQRATIRKELWELLGKLPARPKTPAARILSRQERDTYTVEKFEFDNGAGAVVPGYLMLPKSPGTEPRPAILYCHWHGGEYDIGKEEIFQARHTPEPPGPTLAARGFVVMAIDAYCFGERNGKGPAGAPEKNGDGEMSASKFNLWMGRTLWGMILRDDLMALDYLASRPEVDAKRIGVTGMSMGATRSWWLMALDDRLQAAIAVACLTRYEELIQHHALRAHGIYYFVPGMLNHFDTEAVVALSAPRPILLMNGDQDDGSPVDGIRRIEGTARGVYRLYGKEAAFQSEVYPGQGHVYTRPMWEKTLAWLDQQLKRGR